jgi:hypothetical protein
MNKVNMPIKSLKKVTICDINHQDIYDVYIDDKGYYYDINGNIININSYLNYSTSNNILKYNYEYKYKSD